MRWVEVKGTLAVAGQLCSNRADNEAFFRLAVILTCHYPTKLSSPLCISPLLCRRLAWGLNGA